MTTLLDHKTTLAYLAYLGYPSEPRTEALQVTRPRKTDRRKGKVTRNVFLCYICGAAGSGKTSLLRAFAGKSFNPVYEPTNKMISVVNSVDIDGSEKYLIVSFDWTRKNFNDICNSCKNSDHDMRRKRYEALKRQILQMSSSMYMIQATRTHFHTSAIYGSV